MKIKLLIVFLTVQLILITANVFGQCGSTGGFTVTPSEGCAPLKIVVNNQVPKPQSLGYIYNFNRNQTTFPQPSDFSKDSSYTYQNAGTYTIFQFGSAGATAFSLCKDVVVYETRAPKAELVTCQSGRVRLTLVQDSVAKAYNQIEVNWGDGSPATLWNNGESVNIDHQYSANSAIPAITIRGKYTAGLCESSLNVTTLSGLLSPPSLDKIEIKSVEMSADGTAKLLYEGMEGVPTEIFIDKGDGQFVTTSKTSKLGGLQSVTIENLNPEQIYRFKLISKDFCDNSVESVILGSLKVSEGAFSIDETNTLVWEAYTGSENILQYQLKRDDVVIFATSDQFSYYDSNVKCGINYQYEIVAIIDNDVRSYSAPIIVTPKSSSPEVINKASVSVEDNNLIVSNVAISGEGLTSTYNLIVERANSGSSDFQQISNPNNESLTFEDRNVNTSENSYCYRYSYENACKQSSPSFSEPVCSILLKNNIQEITWNGESPFTDAIDSYDLIEMDATGKITDELPKQLSLSHSIDLNNQSTFSYRVKAHSTGENLLSYSNILDLKRDLIVLIPDVFTPNGDGINDRFEVKSYFTSSFDIKIYSRWGEVVFQSANAAGSWDGNINSKPAQGGYYTFNISITDRFNKTISKTGSFLLIR